MVDSTPLNLVLRTPQNDEPWVINKNLFDILNTYLQPNSALSPADTANEINKLFPLNRVTVDNQENEHPESFLFEMWGVVIGTADQIPWNHPGQDKLVEAIQALKDFPGPKKIQMDGWGSLDLWSDLPLLGPVMTENGYAVYLEDISDAQEAIRERQRNFVSFATRLTRSGLADRSKYFAIQDFREALEQEPDQRSKAYMKQGPRLDVYVPLAGIWILFAGNVILAHCRTPGAGDVAGSNDQGEGWKGPKGYSVERWNFWKRRFGEIKVHNQASDETKRLAADAEEAMKRIETEEA